MKILTVRQPYASLIANGNKIVENRTWKTVHRGELLIHAASKIYGGSINHPLGVVIAKVNLVACVHVNELLLNYKNKQYIPNTKYAWHKIFRHKYTVGPWCWILADVVKVKHIKLKGQLGLWMLDTDTEVEPL